MKTRLLQCVVVIGLVACGGEGPAGPAAPSLAVRVVAPAAIPEKDVIDVEARIVDARGATFPIVVTFEKANRGEPFVGAGFIVLREADERVAVARLPIFRDPVVRATARDASGIEASSEAMIDVLDYR